MKKIYLKPELDVLDMQYTQMIAASLPVLEGEAETPADVLSRPMTTPFDFLFE